MRALIAVIVALVLSACSAVLAELAASNQSKLAQLSVGLSKNDVISLMGTQAANTRDGVVNNPWMVEAYVGQDGAQYEALYYITRKNQPFTPVRKSLTTAIVIKDGKVVGWGENVFQRYK